MKSVASVLRKYGHKYKYELRKKARPNKRTGALDKSIESKVKKGNKEGQDKLEVRGVFYAKYLNKHTSFIDSTVKEVTPDMVDDIANHYVNEVIDLIKRNIKL